MILCRSLFPGRMRARTDQRRCGRVAIGKGVRDLTRLIKGSARTEDCNSMSRSVPRKNGSQSRLAQVWKGSQVGTGEFGQDVSRVGDQRLYTPMFLGRPRARRVQHRFGRVTTCRQGWESYPGLANQCRNGGYILKPSRASMLVPDQTQIRLLLFTNKNCIL